MAYFEPITQTKETFSSPKEQAKINKKTKKQKKNSIALPQPDSNPSPPICKKLGYGTLKPVG